VTSMKAGAVLDPVEKESAPAMEAAGVIRLWQRGPGGSGLGGDPIYPLEPARGACSPAPCGQSRGNGSSKMDLDSPW
jgi:hypothetical protein